MTEQLFAHETQPLDSDERYTPRWLFDAMATTFELDPASPGAGRDHVPARRRYTRADDGLALPWAGLVWLNPPFSAPAPWINRWIAHGAGVLLFPWSVNADWRWRLLGAVRLVATLEHIRFDAPTHTGRHVPVAVALTGLGAGELLVARVAAAGAMAHLWRRVA